jgi:hypothetical protein
MKMFLLYKRIFYATGKNEKGIRNYFVFPKTNFLEDIWRLCPNKIKGK